MLGNIFLTTDETNFLNPKAGFFIPGFIPSIPKNGFPKGIREIIDKFLFYKIPHKNGEVFQCIYGLRKIEAIFLNALVVEKLIHYLPSKMFFIISIWSPAEVRILTSGFNWSLSFS